MDGKHAAAVLQELQERFAFSGAEVMERSSAIGRDFALGRNWLSNIRSKDVIPDLRRIHALSKIFRLELADLFDLFGFRIADLAIASNAFHETRTRLIEHHITGLQNIVVPDVLSHDSSLGDPAYLSQIVQRWRTVRTNHTKNRAWQDPRIFYAKLGIFDSNASPSIPPGAYLQILRTRKLLRDASSRAIYLVQCPWGLTACRCELEDGTLYLRSENPSYPGPFRLKLGVQARILGLVVAYAAALPAEPYRRSEMLSARSEKVSATAPWEFMRPNDLFVEQYRRYGMTRRMFGDLAASFHAQFGINASAKYIEELHSSRHFPRTSTALALSILTATRVSDVFASSGVQNTSHGLFQLEELLSQDCRSLPSTPPQAEPPVPPQEWLALRREWSEWPTLLQHLIQRHPDYSQEILRIDRNASEFGARSLLPEFSFVLMARHRGGFGSINASSRASDWARQLYVIEYGRSAPKLDCGFLSYEDGLVVLTPHRFASTKAACAFKKNDVTILGTIIGIAARLPF